MAQDPLRDLIQQIVKENLRIISRDDRWETPYLTYEMSLSRDRFVHFTSEKRAKEILDDGYLRMNPPYKKFGTDTVDAISIMWGSLVPGVQFTHVMKSAKKSKEGRVVGVVFKTNILPKYGYPEEVKWDRDVRLVDPQVVSFEKAQSLIKRAKFKIPEDVDAIVRYKS